MKKTVDLATDSTAPVLQTDTGVPAPLFELPTKYRPEDGPIHYGIRRKIVSHMTTKSWTEVPHVTFIYEPDITDFFAEFRKLNVNRTNKITFNTLMLRCFVEGIKAAPIINSHLKYSARFVKGKLTPMKEVNITTPWILPGNEMMTINLRDFGEKSLDDIATYIAQVQHKISNTDLDEAMYGVSMANTIDGLKHGHIIQTVERLLGAKIGKHRVKTLSGAAKKEYYDIPEKDRLTIRDLEPGTITISNIGSLHRGQRGAIGILEIIPPQVFAIGLSSAQDRPGVYSEAGEQKIGVRKILPICLAFDHRAMDFGEVLPFMKCMDQIFENPEIMHTW